MEGVGVAVHGAPGDEPAAVVRRAAARAAGSPDGHPRLDQPGLHPPDLNSAVHEFPGMMSMA